MDYFTCLMYFVDRHPNRACWSYVYATNVNIFIDIFMESPSCELANEGNPLLWSTLPDKRCGRDGSKSVREETINSALVQVFECLGYRL